jgi:tRNA(Ile)-lysidine synthase
MNAYFETLPKSLGVSVSGGGDSMALLHLTHSWAQKNNVELRAMTVDHGLRPAAADEANFVKAWCEDRGISHTTFVWESADVTGNIQNEARMARLKFLDLWRGDIGDVLIGHSKSDQAETVMMRLARGSGVDGLSGISETRSVKGDNGTFNIYRPLLSFSREEIREYCRQNDVPWVDDPSNEDEHYTRVKIRKLIASLEVSEERLVKTAVRMSRVRDFLEQSTDKLWTDSVSSCEKGLQIKRDILGSAHEEISLRVLVKALCDVSQKTTPPREEATIATLQDILAGKNSCLHGCLLKVKKSGFIEIMKEVR